MHLRGATMAPAPFRKSMYSSSTSISFFSPLIAGIGAGRGASRWRRHPVLVRATAAMRCFTERLANIGQPKPSGEFLGGLLECEGGGGVLRPVERLNRGSEARVEKVFEGEQGGGQI